MKFRLVITCLIAAFCLDGVFNKVAAKSDEHTAVTVTLNNYMLGSSYNEPKKIKSAFYAEADMFLDHPEKPIYLMTPEVYANLFSKREQGVFNGRYAKILSIDIEGNIATAKAEILIPARDSRYIDIFLLKKLEGEWKIISKAAGRADSTRSGKKTILIANRKADFSDVINAYEEATEAGYTIDIVSPNGGPLLIDDINMKDSKHRDYIYHSDFMYALEHTLSAAEVQPSDYVTAKYISKKKKKKKNASNYHASLDKLHSSICARSTAC